MELFIDTGQVSVILIAEHDSVSTQICPIDIILVMGKITELSV